MIETHPPGHREALAAELGSHAVAWDDDTLASHCRDYWSLSVLRAIGGTLTERPLCVIRPNAVDQIVAALQYATRYRLPVVPFGAGSGVCGGVLPAANAIVVDLRRMNRLLELNETALTARVQAGMMGNAFEAALSAAGYTMGHFPQSIDLSTVGGWISTRAAGQYSTRYGCIEDVLLALEAVLPDGRMLRTRVGPRSATGPDLRHVFLGAEGTMGIVTEATVRICPRPETSRGGGFSFATLAQGLETIRLIMRAGWRPPVVRLYDPIETQRHFPTLGTDDPALLLLLSEGPASLTAAEWAACVAIAAANGGTDVGCEPLEHWLVERNKVAGFEPYIERGFVLDTIEVASTWDRIGDLYREVIAALRQVDGLVVASGHSSHSYAQGTNIYFTFVARPASPANAEATYLECWRQAMEATLRCGGTIAHHHGVGRLRLPWMARELGGGLAVLRALKRGLDPHGIMNPGVLIPDGDE